MDFGICGNVQITGIWKFENPEILQSCMFVGRHEHMKVCMRL